MQTPNTPAGKLTEMIMADLLDLLEIYRPVAVQGKIVDTPQYNRFYNRIYDTLEKQLAPALPLLSPEGHAMFDRAISTFRAKQKYCHGRNEPKGDTSAAPLELPPQA